MPRKKRSETTEARRFGVILTVLLLALAGFSFWRDHTMRAAIVIRYQNFHHGRWRL